MEGHVACWQAAGGAVNVSRHVPVWSLPVCLEVQQPGDGADPSQDGRQIPALGGGRYHCRYEQDGTYACCTSCYATGGIPSRRGNGQ
jgi:hypothetical protein